MLCEWGFVNWPRPFWRHRPWTNRMTFSSGLTISARAPKIERWKPNPRSVNSADFFSGLTNSQKQSLSGQELPPTRAAGAQCWAAGRRRPASSLSRPSVGWTLSPLITVNRSITERGGRNRSLHSSSASLNQIQRKGSRRIRSEQEGGVRNRPSFLPVVHRFTTHPQRSTGRHV